MRASDRIIGRQRNVVRVDFRRQPEPPGPTFPGAAALRKAVHRRLDVCSTAKLTARSLR
jgi:hypothetical protein